MEHSVNALIEQSCVLYQNFMQNMLKYYTYVYYLLSENPTGSHNSGFEIFAIEIRTYMYIHWVKTHATYVNNFVHAFNRYSNE